MQEQSPPEMIQKSGIFSFLVLILLGFVIFNVAAFIQYPFDLIYLICISGFLLLLWLFFPLKKGRNYSINKEILYAFCLASLANTLQWTWRAGGSSIQQIVFAILITTILVIMPIIIGIYLTERNLKSLYFTRGNLKLGLMLGSLVFVIFLFTAIPAATYIFGGKDVTLELFITLIPWIMIFIFLNAFREELWFRGLFLKKYEKRYGEDPSMILQAIIFSIAHLTFPISSFTWIYLILTFLLGLSFGAVMKKTDSIIAPILFHAGADIPLILAVFSTII